jgi:hypothetical protein
MPDAPITPVTPLPGKTTIDDKMVFEPQRLAYESAVAIAARIAQKVERFVKGKTVVIAGTRLLADFANLRAIYVLLDSLRRDYECIGGQARSLVKQRSAREGRLEGFVSEAGKAAATTAVSTVISPAATVVGAALGLISLFRQDVEYHGENTVVDALAFEIALAAEVKCHGAQKASVPDLVVLPALSSDQSMLQAQLNRVQEAKASAWSSVGPLISQLVRLEGELDGAAKTKDQSALDRLSLQTSDMRRDLAPVVDPLGRLDQRLSDLQNQLNQTEPTSGMFQLARLLRAEALQYLEPLYLHGTVVASGGHYRITRNLFRTLFMGDGLSFAGGAVARWALLEKDGSVALGGIESVTLRGKIKRSGLPSMKTDSPGVEIDTAAGTRKSAEPPDADSSTTKP